MLTGNIHSIETAGTLDGGGIRYIIFLQECPLRCKFCHNPDTWTKDNTCHHKTVAELVEDAVKYKEFFNFSNGGVTLSGGEPLIQKEFVLELVKELKKNDIHVAIDTCGYVDIDDTILEIVDNADLLLFDIKQLDNKAHKELTGRENTKILEFLEMADKRDIEIWIKIVILPGISDDETYLKGLAEYLTKFTKISCIELLPYHLMGKAKWEELGYKYPLDIDPPSKEIIDRSVKIFEDAKFKVLCSD